MVPLGGLEPPHLAPEASALSAELQGQNYDHYTLADAKEQGNEIWVLHIAFICTEAMLRHRIGQSKPKIKNTALRLRVEQRIKDCRNRTGNVNA